MDAGVTTIVLLTLSSSAKMLQKILSVVICGSVNYDAAPGRLQEHHCHSWVSLSLRKQLLEGCYIMVKTLDPEMVDLYFFSPSFQIRLIYNRVRRYTAHSHAGRGRKRQPDRRGRPAV